MIMSFPFVVGLVIGWFAGVLTGICIVHSGPRGSAGRSDNGEAA